jgi:hypothetical protein
MTRPEVVWFRGMSAVLKAFPLPDLSRRYGLLTAHLFASVESISLSLKGRFIRVEAKCKAAAIGLEEEGIG